MNNSLVIFFKNKSLFEIFDEIKDLFEYNIKFIKSSDELKSLSRNILEQHVVISEKTNSETPKPLGEIGITPTI